MTQAEIAEGFALARESVGEARRVRPVRRDEMGYRVKTGRPVRHVGPEATDAVECALPGTRHRSGAPVHRRQGTAPA